MLATELFLQRHWIFGSVPCKLVSTVLLLNLYGSVYFLSTISLDRCYAVMAPISARKIRTNMYGWVISFISWLFALAFSAQALFLRKTITYVHNSTYIAQLEEHICLTTRQNQSLCEVGILEPEGTTLQRNISSI